VTTIQVCETFVGHGRVFSGPRPITDVAYSLKAVEELGVHGTADTRAGGFGQPNIYGLVRSTLPNVLGGYVGSRLTLRISEGRALDFTVAKSLGPVIYLIQGLGCFS
jgi:hypothetical protein